MEKLFKKNVPNHEASRKLAREICEQHLETEPHFTLYIEGTLGAGKTFMAKEILQNLGVTQEIDSPTYALVNEYTSRNDRQFAHFDFYRLESPEDFFARGFQDIASDGRTSSIIEWPEKIKGEAAGSFTGKLYVLKIEFGIGVGMRKMTLLKR